MSTTNTNDGPDSEAIDAALRSATASRRFIEPGCAQDVLADAVVSLREEYAKIVLADNEKIRGLEHDLATVRAERDTLRTRIAGVQAQATLDSARFAEMQKAGDARDVRIAELEEAEPAEKCIVCGGDEPCSHDFDKITWPVPTVAPSATKGEAT
jgi:hypothetical protein